jgi:probable F420-dependent oxidoreductase
MRFTVEHPLGRPGCAPELYGTEGMAQFAATVESAGLHTIAFTEHPAPSAKWLATGGHASVDPFSALSFCAAVTTRVRLLTYLLVLPYHNPLITAKSVATVDRLSNGRLTIGVGGGYLRSEFRAVGTDFENRGRRFNEALHVLQNLWDGAEFSYEGAEFTARSVVSTPRPVQRPHPPIWIGGSGRNARRRVAQVGHGWMPLLMGDDMAAITLTQPLSTPADLARAVEELREMVAAEGRAPETVAVQVADPQGHIDADFSVEQRRDHLGQLADAGATDYVLSPPAGSVAECSDALTAYGRDVAAIPRPPVDRLAKPADDTD